MSDFRFRAGIFLAPFHPLFIAAVAERTKRIRLGTGVVSLPYHNPFMVADRIITIQKHNAEEEARRKS
jgi:limonene 1,2-monooxygenase